jgi:hypothetical protein
MRDIGVMIALGLCTVVLIALMLLHGCTTLDSKLGTHTYVVPAADWEQARKLLRIEPCAVGETGIGIGVQAPSGDVALTVRCQ